MLEVERVREPAAGLEVAVQEAMAGDCPSFCV
jgi:hypothetical protein